MEEKSQIRLSICIPTLNRGSYIGTTLENIMSQATDEVEIVIVDGGSKDRTQAVVNQYRQRFPNIRYYREDHKKMNLDSPAPSNGGFDRDCNRAVQLAIGEYCWLFTDDDLLKNGAIQIVLDAMRHDYGLIVVNAEVQNANLSKVLEPKRLQLSEDRIYNPAENRQLFTEVANYLSFVGGVVIRRDLWESRQKEQYIGTGFIHACVVFQSPILEGAFVIADPLITIRYGDALYARSSRFFEIWMFTWPNLIWSFRHFSDSEKSQVCRKEPWRRKRTLLMHRAIGAFSTREYNSWLKPRMKSRLDRFVTSLIARFPGCAANLIGIVGCYIAGRRTGPFFVDLVKSPFYLPRYIKGLGPLQE